MATERIQIIVSERGSRTVKRNFEGIGKSAQKAQGGVKLLRRALGALSGALIIRQVAGLADEFTNLQNRLKLVTDGTFGLVNATEELFGIANRTRSSFKATGDLFARLALSTKELGTSQQELLQFTESLNQAVILSGASATEAAAGIIQLSQGMASGTLRGDELRSVLEQLPAVADVIAKSMGITRGELRLMGQDGKISADIILKAFKEARKELADNFAKTVPTIAQSFAVLRTGVIRFVSSIDQATGSSSSLSRGILAVAANLDLLKAAFNALFPIIQALSALIAVRLVQGALLIAVSAIKSMTIAITALSIRVLPLLASAGVIAFGALALAAIKSGKSVKEVIEDIKVSFGDIVTGVTIPTAAIEDFESRINKFSNEIKALSGDTKPSAKAIAELVGRMRELQQEVTGKLRLTEFLAPGSQAVKDLRDQADRLNQTIKALSTSVITAPKRIAVVKPLDKAQLSVFKRQAREIQGFFDDMFGQIGDSLTDFVTTGKFNFAELSRSLVRSIARIVIEAAVLIPIKNAISGFFQGKAGIPGGSQVQQQNPFAAILGSVFAGGFANGGAFTVPGQGGTDSEMVSFRATPGERVSIATPQQQQGGGSTVVNVINNTEAQAEVQRSQGPNGQEQINVMIEKSVNTQLASGQFDSAMGARFASTPQTVKR